jgi:hypothetical protein
MAAAVCTRAVRAALSDSGVLGMASTALSSKRAYWAVTTVNPTQDDCTGGHIVEVLANSYRVPARDVKIEGSWLGNTVKVWWKR